MTILIRTRIPTLQRSADDVAKYILYKVFKMVDDKKTELYLLSWQCKQIDNRTNNICNLCLYPRISRDLYQCHKCDLYACQNCFRICNTCRERVCSDCLQPSELGECQMCYVKRIPTTDEICLTTQIMKFIIERLYYQHQKLSATRAQLAQMITDHPSCPSCGSNRRHVQECTFCGDHVCRSCGKTCSHCLDFCCDNCVEECYRCGSYFCTFRKRYCRDNHDCF